MRQMLEHDHEFMGEEEPSNDLVLGAPALLGIFFALALVCAICFGFGYSSGYNWHLPSHTPTAATGAASAPSPAKTPASQARPSVSESEGNSESEDAPAAESGPPTQLNQSNQGAEAAKPAPGVAASPYWPPASASSPDGDSAIAGSPDAPRPGVRPQQNAAAAVAASRLTALQPRTQPVPQQYSEQADAPRERASAAETATPGLLAPAPTRPAASPTTPLGDGFMVQIAAVTHAADAQTLSTALRHDGFAPIVRTTTGDQYFHVQVGPFPTIAAARAMRSRLTDSGYNAFIKP